MRWNEFTSEELARLPKGDTVAILPIGSVEIHGPHLPLGIDGLVITRIAELAAAREPPAVVLPCLDYAYVNENVHHPGTISLSARTLVAVVEEICDEVGRNGFKKILLLNGHGGNNHILRSIQRDLLRPRRDYVTYMCTEPWAPIQRDIDALSSGSAIEHACEIETSIAMYLFGDLLKLDRVHREATLGRVELPDYVKTSTSWQGYCLEGYVGDPRKATMEKGKTLVDKWVSAIADLIKSIREDDVSPRVLDEYYRRANL